MNILSLQVKIIHHGATCSLLLGFYSLPSNGFFDGTETVWPTGMHSGLEAGDLEQNT